MQVRSCSKFLEETLDGVGHQAADCHRAHSAGDRSDDGSLGLHGCEIDVSAEFAVLVKVHSDIDYRSSFLDHIPGHELRLPDGGHEDVSLPCDFRQILGAGMADRHGCIPVEKQLGYRKADNLATAKDHSLLPFNHDIPCLKKLYDAHRGARDHT